MANVLLEILENIGSMLLGLVTAAVLFCLAALAVFTAIGACIFHKDGEKKGCWICVGMTCYLLVGLAASIAWVLA